MFSPIRAQLRTQQRASRISSSCAAVAVVLALLLVLPTGSVEAGTALATAKDIQKKAIYILPGICGSDLFASEALSVEELLERAPEFTGSVERSVTASPGESLWLPRSLHPLSALAMLSCDKDGHPNMEVTATSDPMTYGPLGVYQY